MIRIALTGACGKMGQAAIKAIESAQDLELIAAIDPSKHGLKLLAEGRELTVAGDYDSVSDLRPDVLLEFSGSPDAAKYAREAIEDGVNPVIGSTGIAPSQLDELRNTCRTKKLGAIYAPNFSLGALLMMRFAAEAAKWMPNAEVIEMHHENKADAPSGTAIRTADLIAEARRDAPVPDPTTNKKLPGARGGTHMDVHIHSVRLPGLLAHQMVIFGSAGEMLTLRHDSTDRDGFMPGVLAAVRRVRSLDGLVIGLENVLFDSQG